MAGDKKPAGEKKEATPSLVQDKLDEAEADKGPQGAFNEETGEINWDCPVCPPLHLSLDPWTFELG
jgi:hypothetical protein